MNDSIEAIKDLGISIEALSLKTKGQTSNTFIGKYEGKKIVVKILLTTFMLIQVIHY